VLIASLKMPFSLAWISKLKGFLVPAGILFISNDYPLQTLEKRLLAQKCPF
jgi:hypothetical protein